MNPDHLRAIRDFELQRVASLIAPGSRILELGAGAGWQSMRLEQEGHTVFAVDIPSSRYKDHAIFPVLPYDGRRLPFAGHSFDIVLSSNVLEHISDPTAVQTEIHRVLRPGGLAIHIVPTTAWRFWTSVMHYPGVLKEALSLVKASSPGSEGARGRLPPTRALRLVAWPHRHGEKGTALSELYWFSKAAWRRFFRRHEWQLVAAFPNRIFYTGYSVLGPLLSLDRRAAISLMVGSATMTFVMK